MFKSDFYFDLPQELIAQNPAFSRDHSRLMVLDGMNKKIVHKRFYDLEKLLGPNDVLVFNNSKVIPARLYAQEDNKEGRICEILLLQEIKENVWEAMVKPGKKFKLGSKFQILKKDRGSLSDMFCNIEKINDDGTRIIKIENVGENNEKLFQLGHVPLPPYITFDNEKEEIYETRYQTIYADEQKAASVAAPSAGLHFTEELLSNLADKGVQMEFVTLHVGAGTFLPVKSQNIEDHQMHSEYFSLDQKTADHLNQAKKNGKRIIAVGTTSIRVLESCANDDEILKSKSGETNIFIKPGYKFKFVDSIITNFHLPESTLIILICAFGGKDFILNAYQEAIKKKYRFYSFGDAMLIQFSV